MHSAVMVMSGAQHLDRSWAAARAVVTGYKVFAFAGRRAEAARTEFRFETVCRHFGTGPFVLQTLGETQWQQLLDQAAAGGRRERSANGSVRSARTTRGTSTSAATVTSGTRSGS